VLFARPYQERADSSASHARDNKETAEPGGECCKFRGRLLHVVIDEAHGTHRLFTRERDEHHRRLVSVDPCRKAAPKPIEGAVESEGFPLGPVPRCHVGGGLRTIGEVPNHDGHGDEGT
jgi:hypothetical protein